MIAIRVPTSEPWILEYNQQSTRLSHVKLTIHKQGGVVIGAMPPLDW